MMGAILAHTSVSVARVTGVTHANTSVSVARVSVVIRGDM
jgi:hypothetical protein